MLFNRAVFVAQSVAYTHYVVDFRTEGNFNRSRPERGKKLFYFFGDNYSKQDYLICFKFIGNGQALGLAIFATLFFKVGPIARARA